MIDPLNQFDMAIALSEAQINLQFFEMLNTRIINPEFHETIKIKVFSFTANVTFQAKVQEVVLVVTEDKPYQPLFIMGFDEMTVSSGTSSYVIPSGLKYAFNVNMSKLSQKYNKNLSVVTPQAKQALDNTVSEASQSSGINASEFTIQSLFLDFDNSNIVNYNSKASNLKPLEEAKIPITLSVLQPAIADHFKNLAGTKNPYILGYAVKTPFVQNTNALFKPTDCYVSTSYNEKVSLSAFNFLMMIDDNPIKNWQSSGILNQSLITSTASEVDGAFAIQYLSFRKAVIEPINTKIETHLSDLLTNLLQTSGLNETRNTQHTGIFGSGSYNHIETVASPNAGNLSAQGDYNWSAQGAPWNITVNSSATLNQDYSDIVDPPARGGGGLTTHFYNYLETDNITPVISINNSDNGIEINLEIRIVGSQTLKEKTTSTNLSPTTSESSGYFQNYGMEGTQVSSITISIESGTDGTITTSTSYQKGNFVQQKPDFKGDASPLFSETNINFLHNSLENLSSNLSESIKKNLVQAYSTKTIFPLSNLYTYKNLRLKFSDSYSGADNIVVADISYEPKTNNG